MAFLGRFLFPAEPRPLPGRRGLKIGFRALHALCAAFLLGAVAFEASPDTERLTLHCAVGTGVLLLLLDLHETGVFLVQVRGLVVLIKLSVVAALPWMAAGRVWALAAIFVLSVLSSHAPASVRYRVLIGGDSLRGSTSKG